MFKRKLQIILLGFVVIISSIPIIPGAAALNVRDIYGDMVMQVEGRLSSIASIDYEIVDIVLNCVGSGIGLLKKNKHNTAQHDNDMGNSKHERVMNGKIIFKSISSFTSLGAPVFTKTMFSNVYGNDILGIMSTIIITLFIACIFNPRKIHYFFVLPRSSIDSIDAFRICFI